MSLSGRFNIKPQQSAQGKESEPGHLNFKSSTLVDLLFPFRVGVPVLASHGVKIQRADSYSQHQGQVLRPPQNPLPVGTS